MQLGFCEEPHHSDPLLFDDRDWHNWDGGIAGGAPQWLDARAPPGDATLRCEVCAAPMAFVLQVYAPREDGVIMVAAISDGFKFLSEYNMGERSIATTVPVRDQLLIRGEKHLFCIAK